MAQAVTHLTLDALLRDTFINPLDRHGLYSRRRQIFLLDVVKSLFQHGKLSLWRFLHFYAPKMSEFPEFTPKVPKITKGTI
jgi:hypothetical protein